MLFLTPALFQVVHLLQNPLFLWPFRGSGSCSSSLSRGWPCRLIDRRFLKTVLLALRRPITLLTFSLAAHSASIRIEY